MDGQAFNERFPTMNNITIGRLKDSDAQGFVRTEDGSWQVVIDHAGVPHLYIRVQTELDGEKVPGMLALDDLLPEGLSVAELMAGTFGGEPEDQKSALAELQARRAVSPVPCPK